MEALAMIYRETGADIILSSTWRLWENNTGRDAVDKALVRFGLPKTVGLTPDLQGGGRAEEIREYLKTLPDRPEWIALDDIDMRRELGRRSIVTPAKTGLRMKHARLAIAVLNDLPFSIDSESDSDEDHCSESESFGSHASNSAA